MSSQSDWKLILRYLNNSMTPEEEERFNLWLKSDFENRKLINLMETIWDTPEDQHNESDLKSAWEKLAKKGGISAPFEESPARMLSLNRPAVKKAQSIRSMPIYRILRYAAILIIILSMPYLYRVMKSPPQEETGSNMQEVVVEYGKTAELTLADETKITLDAGTSFSYPKDFTNEIREVYLNGEGFFEVASNSQKPFIIHANEAVIKVIGTQFNVSAWSEKQLVEVVVAEGRVSLRSLDHPEEEAVIIDKGHLSVLHDNQILTRPDRVDVSKHLAWLTRELIFDNTPLFEVLDRLERWYKLQFKLPNPAYNSVKISGTIKGESINYIIETISLMVNLEYKRNGNNVVFVEKLQ